MKKTILKFLVIILFVQAQGLSAFAQFNESQSSQFSQTDLFDVDALQSAFENGELSEDQYDYYMDVVESGGDVGQVDIPEDRLLTPEQEILVNDSSIKDIGAPTSVEELQKYSQKQVAGYGQWGFHFVYIGNDGTRKELTSYMKNAKIRPASTLKIFTANLAFDKKTFSRDKLAIVLQKSKNGLADAALRSVAKAQPNYRVTPGSYLLSPALMNYRMSDTTEGRSQIIDTLILRGCSLMISEYSGLEDSSKFHPVNGSGLQQTNKDSELQTNTVTPRLQTALLEKILSTKTKYNSFKHLLTSPGKPGGTLYNSFQSGRKLARIYAKTGTLGNGKALAGYAETKNGVIAFSIIGDKLRGVNTKSALKVVIENVVFSHLAYAKNKGL